MSEASERLRKLESDHEPDGWPAVQMCDIKAVLDERDSYREELERLLSVVGDDDYELILNLLGRECEPLTAGGDVGTK
jgi:hypothetical protein